MLIPYTNAYKFIGHVNPGVGYEWLYTNGTWNLIVPQQGPALDVFWPVFLTIIAVTIAGASLCYTLSRK